MHHTKEKGDLGNLKIAAEIAAQGFKVLVPVSEHLPFDLVAYDQETGNLYKIQSKYCSINKLGLISIGLKSTYSSSSGKTSKRYTNNSFDILAVYCPNLEAVIFISEKEVQKLSSTINFSISKQYSNNRYWKDYTDIKKAISHS